MASLQVGLFAGKSASTRQENASDLRSAAVPIQCRSDDAINDTTPLPRHARAWRPLPSDDVSCVILSILLLASYFLTIA